MKLTAPDNLPYPEAGDDLNPLDEWFADLAKATQAALTDGSDGWVTPKLTTGLVAQNNWGFRVRRGRVQWQGALAWSDSSKQWPGGYTTVTNDLPVAGRPLQYFRAPISIYNGLVANLIITGGRMDVGISGTSGNAVYFGGVSYDND